MCILCSGITQDRKSCEAHCVAPFYKFNEKYYCCMDHYPKKYFVNYVKRKHNLLKDIKKNTVRKTNDYLINNKDTNKK